MFKLAFLITSGVQQNLIRHSQLIRVMTNRGRISFFSAVPQFRTQTVHVHAGIFVEHKEIESEKPWENIYPSFQPLFIVRWRYWGSRRYFQVPFKKNYQRPCPGFTNTAFVFLLSWSCAPALWYHAHLSLHTCIRKTGGGTIFSYLSYDVAG